MKLTFTNGALGQLNLCCTSHSLVGGQQMHGNKFCLAVIMFLCTHW